jgi:hypothetical protein
MYRRDFRYFVTGDYPSAESQVQEIFRRNAALSKSDRIAIQEFVRLCEYEDFLEREYFSVSLQRFLITHNIRLIIATSKDKVKKQLLWRENVWV